MNGKTLDKLTTVKSGRAYRAVIGGTVHFFELDQDNTGVFVRTRAGTLGGYRLDRFHEKLTPTTIRAFLRLAGIVHTGVTTRELGEMVNARDAITFECVDAFRRKATCRECGHIIGPYAREGRTDSPELSREAFEHVAFHVMEDWQPAQAA